MRESNSNKQWKRMPFEIELAKKIQAREVEGRFISSKGYPVRIICFDFRNWKKEYHILFAVEYSTHEGIFSCDDEGRVYGNNFWLSIELPEEAQEEQHPIAESELYQTGYKVGFEAGRCVAFDEKKGYAIKKEAPKHEFKVGDNVSISDYNGEDAEIYKIVKIRENLAFLNDGSTIPLDGLVLRESKHEFKAGDKVRVNYPYEMKEKRTFQGEILTITQVMDSYVIAVGQGIQEVCLAFDEIEPYEEKHEFKPFDKVLVRMSDEEIWKVSLYGFKREDGTHCCVNTSCWEQCIPFAGNEHLVGTTDNPE